MSSPFVIFRRHQRVLMVVITGLSMISFVLLGAVQDPTHLPVPLIVLFVAALVGGVAWLAGLSSGKGAEWGLAGTVAGAVVALAIAFSSRPVSAVYIDSGNLSDEEVSRLRTQRYVVNQFVNSAFQQTFGRPLQTLPAPVQRSFNFGFSNSGDVSVDDVVVGEILRREADKMGIVISDQIVTEFIKQVTTKEGLSAVFDRVKGQMADYEYEYWTKFLLPGMKQKSMTQQAFTKLRQQLRISEAGLLNAIRDELKIRQAYQLLAGNNYFPPEQFWGYYQKLNVKQSAEIASIPVKDFVDQEAQPTDADLLKLFEQYSKNFPGYTPEGKPEPGRPGFYQPRRFQLGYLEANYELIEPLVGEVSDEEIQTRYAEKYLKQVPDSGALQGPDLPLPPPGKPAMPQGEDQPADKPAEKPVEKPAAPASPPAEKPADKPAAEAPKADTPKTEAPKADAPKLDAPKTDASEADTPKAETPKAEDAKPAPQSSSSLMKGLSSSQTVAFLLADEPAANAPQAEAPKADAAKKGDAPQAEAPKTDTPKADAPKLEAPSAEKPAEAKPAAEKPADAKMEKKEESKPAADEKPAAPTGDKKAGDDVVPPAPSEMTPPAPKNEVPPLDDAMKAQLRSEILQERTKAEIAKRMEAAYLEMADISTDLTREKTESDYLTLEQATKKLQAYAEANQLAYVVTPMLSEEDLADSKDHPIGQASLPQRMTVAEALRYSSPADLYRVNTASDFTTSSAYVYWKLQDKAAYAPVTLDDEKELRDAVTEAWRLELARPKAKARAEELAKMVRQSDQPMGTVLAEQTVTGSKESLFVPVRITGDFTWMQKPMVPATGMMQSMPVGPSIIPGATDAGEEFFKAVFDELQVGEVGVAPGNQLDNYYVVKIESRDPSNPEQMEALRKKFLAEGMKVNGYSSMLQQSLMQNSVNWLQQLFEEHNVSITRRDEN